MTIKGRCIALARYQDGETDCEAYLLSQVTTRRGHVRQGYSWRGEHGERLDHMRSARSREHMIRAAKVSRHFHGIVLLSEID